MDTLKQQVQALDPAEWVEFLGWVTGTERARRDALPAIEEAQAQLVEELWEAKPELKPETGTTDITPADTEEALVAQVKPWQQPATPLDGYLRSELAALGGRVWRNHRPGNTKRPGTPFSGWEDVTADYLKLADAVDGNAEGVGTDAPGVITEPTKPVEPEQPITPAPMVQPWQAGQWYSKGELALDDGVAYASQRLHKATENNRPTKNTGDWLKLG